MHPAQLEVQLHCSSDSHCVTGYMSLGVICCAVSVNESIPADTLSSIGPLPSGVLQSGSQVMLYNISVRSHMRNRHRHS